MGAPSYNNFRNLITFSRGTNATLFDSTGRLTYGPNNLLVNTATLSTQTVNTNLIAGCDVILSFRGTGSVAISGGFTGTLAGTGASNRVSLKFTTTTTSLTFTVTGTVTEAQLERVTYQTTPSTYNASTASQFFGPRLDYDPVTLALRGMLVEEQRINLLLRSEDFSNATWAKTALNTTGTPAWVNVGISPDGTQTADSLIEDTTNNIHTVEQFSSVSASTAYTHSFFFKRNVGNRDAFIQVNITGSSGILGAGFAWFGLTGNGTASSITTLSGTFSGTSATITPVGGSWYRCTLSFTSNVGATGVTAYIGPYNGARSYIGDGSSILIWGAQLEAGAFATSYIPTGASSVTRNADVATMSGSQFTPWYNGTQGTLVEDATWSGVPSGFLYGCVFNDGALNSAVSFISNGGVANGRVRVATVDQFNGGVTPAVNLAGSRIRQIIAFAPNNIGYCVNGSAVNSTLAGTASGVVPTADRFSFTWSAFGARHIRSITYYPRRLSNTQLQRLTA